MPKTLFEKIWDAHVVSHPPNSPAVLYIDLHLIHEVTSPQALPNYVNGGLRPVVHCRPSPRWITAPPRPHAARMA